MDVSLLLKKSFEIAWNNRVLWLFGLLSGGFGGGGWGLSFNFPSSGSFREEGKEKIYFLNELPGYLKATAWEGGSFPLNLDIQAWGLIILGVVLLILLLVLAFIFLSTWSEAALIYSVLKRNQARPNFRDGARAGLKYWWKFYLSTLVFGLVVFILILMFALPFILLFFSDLRSFAFVYLVFALFLFFITIFAISIAAGLILNLAKRMIVHRGTGVLESIRLAGGLVKKNLGESAIAYGVSIGVGFVVGFGMLFVLIPVGIVMLILFFINIYAGLITLIPALILFMMIGGLIGAFNGTYWTLFYEHLASKEEW